MASLAATCVPSYSPIRAFDLLSDYIGSLSSARVRSLRSHPPRFPLTRVAPLINASTWPSSQSSLAQLLVSLPRPLARAFPVSSFRPDVAVQRSVRTRAGSDRAGEGGDGEGPSVGGLSDEIDFSVFRFTLGLPWLDDRDVPLLVGLLMGAALLVNHGLTGMARVKAQGVSELLGCVLVCVSLLLPFLDRKLKISKGGRSSRTSPPPSSLQPLFLLSDGLSDQQRQDTAWATYTALRNTNATALLLLDSRKNLLCARGSFLPLPPALAPPSLPSLSSLLASLLQSSPSLATAISASQTQALPLTVNAGLSGVHSSLSPARHVLVVPLVPSVPSPLLETTAAGTAAAAAGGATAPSPSPLGTLMLISESSEGFSRNDRGWMVSLAGRLHYVLQR